MTIFGMLMLLSSNLISPQANATGSYWHVGGFATETNIESVSTDVDVVPPPTTNAIVATTLYWLGADTNNGYLTQPELRASSTSLWQGSFETVYNPTNTQKEFYWTNVYFSSPASVHFLDWIQSGGADYQLIQDNNQISHSASRTLTGANYGTSIVKEYATLESYDYICSEFNPMTTIHFTNYKTQPIGGTLHSPFMGIYYFGNPPACFSGTAGTGWATIVTP